MPKHFAEFIGRTTSYGVIIIPQKLPVRAAIEDLLLIWTASEAEEWHNRIQVLPL
jgi:CRISPR/Cas system-associated protein Cas10 (large subunit of type III CRISPR-Cas system)